MAAPEKPAASWQEKSATAALDAYQKARKRKDQLHAGKVAGVLGGLSMASDTIKAMPTFNPISASRF